MTTGESRAVQDRRELLHDVIFGTDTPAGKAFDVVLLLAIVVSLLMVALDSVESVAARFGGLFTVAEWLFTVLFTVEYGLRLYSAHNRGRYAVSFFGLVDLLAILPTYLSLIVGGGHQLLVIRALRLLRVFRVLKLVRMIGEANQLLRAVRASAAKILVFVGCVLTIALIVGSFMYLIEEGADSGFDSIPRGMYWAIVTVTTVGYGDIAPKTVAGQMLATSLMIIGYGIIAVPTGIVSAEWVQQKNPKEQAVACDACGSKGHATDASYCRVCGGELE